MEKQFGEAYRAIWTHLADKYGSEGSSVSEILNESSVHVVLTRYFSGLSDAEKKSLTDELKVYEEKNNLV
ncbi:MAG: hypothetical protein LBN93_07985 [Candidatus Symbiothrix sp.]|jgi:hypothetical protein|nr:hypothetical protein [Candidatus Symbiothrix sp.]